MASQASSANDVKTSFFDIQQQGNEKKDITYNVEQQLKHKPFHDYLSKLSPVYLQDTVLLFKDSDQDLILNLEPLQANIHEGLKTKGYHGNFISIGSSKGQLKIQSLNELDLAFLIHLDKSYISQVTSRSHVYHVEKGNQTIGAREFRDRFGQDVQEILSNIQLPTRLAHSGYCSPNFSGIRYNGPATTMLLVWDPEGEAREISVDITPMLHLPTEDEQAIKERIRQKTQQMRDEMPQEIFRFEGIYMFPNPISNQWELTTACYEATNLLPHLSRDSPFKSCILMCKSMASLMASIPTTTSEAQETKIMKQVVESLVEQDEQTPEVMKYGHAFLTSDTGKSHKEMSKKAISINTAAITHLTLELASGMHGAFTSIHDPDERQRITQQLVTDIFWYLSSGKHDVQHFFLDSQISLLAIATWARQMYNTQQLVDNVKSQCLLTAHLLSHWNIEELDQDVNQHVDEVPDEDLQYIEDTFRVRAHFNGEGCNQTFGIILKICNALGNTMGGIIQVNDPGSTDMSKQKLWMKAFKEHAAHCSMKENIQFLEEEHKTNALVLHVPKFAHRKSLTSYKVHSPAVEDQCEEIKDTAAYKKQQCHLKRQMHYFMENKQIKSTGTTVEQGRYTAVRRTRNVITHTDVVSSEPLVYESSDTRKTQIKQDAHTSLRTTGVTVVDSDSVPIDSVSADEANKKLRKYNKLGWATNKHNWENNVRPIDIDVESSAKELIDSEKGTLKLTSPGTYIPSKENILHRHPQLGQLLRSIEEQFTCKDALIIVCDSWPRQVDIGMAPQPTPTHHVLDVVVFDRFGTVGIWCVVDNLDETKLSPIWQYAVRIGQSTKSSFHNLDQNLHIQCNVYLCSDNRMCQSAKVFRQQNDVGKNVMYLLACLLIRKKSHLRNCLGEDIGVYLTAKQMSVILQTTCTSVALVEGPPGSGKTLMAFHVCSRYNPNQVLYICTTVTYQSYLRFQQNCTPELVQSEADMKRFIKKGNLENCKCIIIDDGHQLACSHKVWRKFLLMAKEKSCQVYIFADSQYQNFSAVDSRALNKCIEEMTRTGDASNHHLHDIHRNSRRVSSFLVASTEETHSSARSGDKIGCSSIHEGHDVEVQSISNIFERSETNGLVQLISDLSMGSVSGQDIAILVDTKHPIKDVDNLSQILKQFTEFPVHSAGHFPIEGITLDTLDNFLGFDRKVCICIVKKQVKEKTSHIFGSLRNLFQRKMDLTRHLQNPKYRTFVASRGVSRVIFVIDVPMSTEVARFMKMDLLPPDPVPRRMWAKEGAARDVTWTAAAASPALIYITESGDIRLVSESGESLPLQIDTAGTQEPRCVASTADGAAVLVVHGPGQYSWTVFRRESEVSYSHQATYQLQDQPSRRDIEPVAARWTHDADVVMVVIKMSSRRLRKYRVSDGDLLWEAKDVGSSYVMSPGELSVCQQSGHILLSDVWGVCVYSPAGELLHHVPRPDRLPDIRSVCAVRKDTWLSGHGDGSVRLWGVSDTARAEHVLVDTGESGVWGLALSGDRLLAVRTGTWVSNKLIVYNVAGCLE